MKKFVIRATKIITLLISSFIISGLNVYADSNTEAQISNSQYIKRTQTVFKCLAANAGMYVNYKPTDFTARNFLMPYMLETDNEVDKSIRNFFGHLVFYAGQYPKDSRPETGPLPLTSLTETADSENDFIHYKYNGSAFIENTTFGPNISISSINTPLSLVSIADSTAGKNLIINVVSTASTAHVILNNVHVEGELVIFVDGIGETEANIDFQGLKVDGVTTIVSDDFTKVKVTGDYDIPRMDYVGLRDSIKLPKSDKRIKKWNLEFRTLGLLISKAESCFSG